MSDFSDMGLIRQEVVHIFRILIKHRSNNYLHTCGTHKAHHARFLCLLCAHRLVPGVRTYLFVRATLKFGVRASQRRVPI